MYDSILMIVNHYMKMTCYLFTKKTLTVVKLTELFFEKIALRYEISNNIIINKDNLFINMFWSKICFHMKMKWWLSIVFHLQTDDQTEWQNQILKHYLRIFFISSLSACSLWLWHCLNAVHMLNYMYLDQSCCFISFHWSITLIVCANKHFQSNNFFLSCFCFLASSCSFHFTLSFLIIIFLLQFEYFSSTLALRFFQSWW